MPIVRITRLGLLGGLVNSTAASVIWRHAYATVGWHVVTVTVMTTRGNYVQQTLILGTV